MILFYIGGKGVIMRRRDVSSPTTAEEAFLQAERYYKNAKQTLKKSPIEYDIYKEEKYVKEASAMAYLSLLRAIDGYLLNKGKEPNKLPTSITEYIKTLQKIPHNGKLMSALTIGYQNLHILGYYRGGVNVDMIKAGFKAARSMIDTLSKTFTTTKTKSSN
jgi:hypothetical protein